MRVPLIITILVIVTLLASCSDAQVLRDAEETTPEAPPDTRIIKLTEAQAVELAETFIAENGYTDLLPSKEHLAYESIEWEPKVDEMLRMRHDTLEGKAFGIADGRKGKSAGWTVVFKYTNSSDQQTRKNGRAVTMNSDGSEARVEHKDFILAKVDKKL
ncbi:MAG: hypothetical protein ABI481_03470 [Pyrinomonadaceae bacterium]